MQISIVICMDYDFDMWSTSILPLPPPTSAMIRAMKTQPSRSAPPSEMRHGAQQAARLGHAALRESSLHCTPSLGLSIRLIGLFHVGMVPAYLIPAGRPRRSRNLGSFLKASSTSLRFACPFPS